MKSKIIILGILASSMVLMNACEPKFRGKKILDNEIETTKTEAPQIEASNVEDSKVEPIENDNKHLEFKGIPINGSLNKFVTNMKTAGFKTVANSNERAILEGDFAGYKDCTLYVQTIDGADIVSTIVVEFPEYDRWEHLYGNYKNLKEMLTQKYGKPHSVREEFQDYMHRTDDDKMRQVHKGECKYKTEFHTEKGKIILWIEQGEDLIIKSGSICLKYIDKINIGVIKQKAIDDL